MILALACSAVARTAVGADDGGVAVQVPFLPQTERLCGGAAAAMMFRFWGERHAGVQQFAPLVDRPAGGIPADRLVEAIAERGWTVDRLAGTVEAIRDHVARRQPLILLIEVRPKRYHFVVAVAVGSEHVTVHDPAVGPSRRYSIGGFVKAWAPTGYWALRVLPRDPDRSTADERRPEPLVSTPALRPQSACDTALAAAVDRVRQQGLEAADALLGAVRAQCPASSGAVSELAGVRFAQLRFVESAALSAEATRLNPADAYGWDILGSSRFARRDLAAALGAWNVIAKPRLDSVQIEGLTHTRYALAAEFLGLTPGRLLTRSDFERAERRLRALPTQWNARLDFVPDDDGWGTVRAKVVERTRRPHGSFEWVSAVGESLVRREVAVTAPGWTGQGELWSAGWRFWPNRPRVTVGYIAPRTGRVPGVVGVTLAQASQTYSTGSNGDTVTQDHLHGVVSLDHWMTGAWRSAVNSSLDRWDGSRLAASIGARLERRLSGDRVALALSGQHWWSLASGSGFRTGAVTGQARSKPTHEGLVVLAQGSYRVASARAPLSEWPGAGDQGVDSALLRAHPLTHGGVVDGAGFGRRQTSATTEVRWWFDRPVLVRLGAAGFVDLVRSTDRLQAPDAARVHLDAGIGVRLRVPGRDEVIRLDYGRGLRDRAYAVTVGWTR